MRWCVILAVLIPLLALASCANPPSTGVVMVPNPYPIVPPPVAEQRPLPPPSEDQLVWRPGEWEWADNGYVWRPGQYETLAGHSNQFLPGHWAAHGNSWVWERGHWL
jgi:hypothetical protein